MLHGLAPMSDSELPASPTPRLGVTLAATGYAACFFIWLSGMAAIAILGAHSPMAMPALMAVFAGGLVLIVLMVVLRLLGAKG